jgi:hypothetical protein
LHPHQRAALHVQPTADRVAQGWATGDVVCPVVGVAWAWTVERRCLQLNQC